MRSDDFGGVVVHVHEQPDEVHPAFELDARLQDISSRAHGLPLPGRSQHLTHDRLADPSALYLHGRIAARPIIGPRWHFTRGVQRATRRPRRPRSGSSRPIPRLTSAAHGAASSGALTLRAYDHPFEDGNGRTARALFYWSMLRHGYRLTEFLSISSLLNRAPGRYGRAFLYTETDGLDAAYFVLNQLRIILRAIDELHAYLARKVREVRETERLLGRTSTTGSWPS